MDPTTPSTLGLQSPLMNITRFKDIDRERKAQFERSISVALGTLLQQKHLYQSVVVPATNKYLLVKPDGERTEETSKFVTEAMEAPWSFDPPNSRTGNVCFVKPPDVKLFCNRCDRVEAYNLSYAIDLLRNIEPGHYNDRGNTDQAFVLAYKCQSCKRIPEVFLIRRRGLKLTNEGRSPIEHVDVPVVIPKAVARFVSGALVAHQSGQTLAGVFLLRTAVEQWARLASGSTSEKADQVMEDYMVTLPEDFKGRFPSLRTLYGDLSADIHTAQGSAELFDRGTREIIEHFEARRLFKVTEPARG